MVAIAAATAIATILGKPRIVIALGAALAALLAGPLIPLACAGAAVAVVAWKKAAAKTARARLESASELLAVEVTSLAAVSGMPFTPAVRLAGRQAGGSVGRDIANGLRRTASGLDAEPDSEVIKRLFAEAERSATTGSSLVPALDTLATSIRADRAAASLEQLNKLPVKLLFPLALLILPGFVLMTVGPAVVGGLSRVSL